MTEKPVWCRRYLESMSMLDGSAAVTGWAFGRDAGALKRIDAEIRPVGTGRSQSLEILSSPDVAAAFPTFAAASRCRFRLVLSIGLRETVPSFLVLLKPVFEGGGGRTWCIGNGLL